MSTKSTELVRIKDKYFRDLNSTTYKLTYLYMNFLKKDDLKQLEEYKAEAVNDEDVFNEYDSKYTRAVTNRIKMEIISVITDSGKAFPEIKKLESAESHFQIIVDDIDLKCMINEDKNVEGEYTWEVIIEGDFFVLEEYRYKILIKMQPYFGGKYCLQDDISHEISLKAYPMINRVENKLREYLLRFFVKKVGNNWWSKNTNSTLQQKSSDRKDGRDFASILDMGIYNLDFLELLDLIDKNFENRDDHNILQTLDAIINAKNDPSLVELKTGKLREKFQSNWIKHFEKYITIEKFSEKWKRLYQIRCIICHNSLVKLDTFVELAELYELVFNKLDSIIATVHKEALTITEKESILRKKESSDLFYKLNNLENICLSKEDILSIIERNSLIFTKKNIVVAINREEFEKFTKENINQLEIISSIKNYEMQGHDLEEESIDDIKEMCVIYFDDIPTEKMDYLKAEVHNFRNYFIS